MVCGSWPEASPSPKSVYPFGRLMRLRTVASLLGEYPVGTKGVLPVRLLVRSIHVVQGGRPYVVRQILICTNPQHLPGPYSLCCPSSPPPGLWALPLMCIAHHATCRPEWIGHALCHLRRDFLQRLLVSSITSKKHLSIFSEWNFEGHSASKSEKELMGLDGACPMPLALVALLYRDDSAGLLTPATPSVPKLIPPASAGNLDR